MNTIMTLRPNEDRARNAILMIWIVLGTEIISLISGYMQYSLLNTVLEGGSITTDEAAMNDSREQIVGILSLGVYVGSIITFLLWFRRAYFNIHLKIKNLLLEEWWAVAAWFVPFINLYRPYQIMKELYEETKNYLEKQSIKLERFTSEKLWIWWALWIVNGVVGQIVFRYSMRAEEINELATATIMGMIMNVLGVPLAFMAVKVIKDYSQVEPLLHKMGIDSQEEADVEEL